MAKPMTHVATQIAQQIAGDYVPTAVYFSDSDCVEYVKEDAFAIYERVDEFLTLIFDETKIRLIGFKLKGFRCIYEKHLKPLFELNDSQFLGLVSAIEAVCTVLGEQLVADDERARAYKAALKLAANDNVRLYDTFLDHRAAA
jgi:hypothetical protein